MAFLQDATKNNEYLPNIAADIAIDVQAMYPGGFSRKAQRSPSGRDRTIALHSSSLLPFTSAEKVCFDGDGHVLTTWASTKFPIIEPLAAGNVRRPMGTKDSFAVKAYCVKSLKNTNNVGRDKNLASGACFCGPERAFVQVPSSFVSVGGSRLEIANITSFEEISTQRSVSLTDIANEPNFECDCSDYFFNNGTRKEKSTVIVVPPNLTTTRTPEMTDTSNDGESGEESEPAQVPDSDSGNGVEMGDSAIMGDIDTSPSIDSDSNQSTAIIAGAAAGAGIVFFLVAGVCAYFVFGVGKSSKSEKTRTTNVEEELQSPPPKKPRDASKRAPAGKSKRSADTELTSTKLPGLGGNGNDDASVASSAYDQAPALSSNGNDYGGMFVRIFWRGLWRIFGGVSLTKISSSAAFSSHGGETAAHYVDIESVAGESAPSSAAEGYGPPPVAEVETDGQRLPEGYAPPPRSARS